MELQPIRERLTSVKQRLGQRVLEGIERYDSAFDVFADEEDLECYVLPVELSSNQLTQGDL